MTTAHVLALGTLALLLSGSPARAQDTLSVDRLQEAALRSDPRAAQRSAAAAGDRPAPRGDRRRPAAAARDQRAGHPSERRHPSDVRRPRHHRARFPQGPVADHAGRGAAALRRRRGRPAARAGGGAPRGIGGGARRVAVPAPVRGELGLLLRVPLGEALGGVRGAGGRSRRAPRGGARAGRRGHGAGPRRRGDRGRAGAGRAAAGRGAGLAPRVARDSRRPGRASRSTRPPCWCCRATSPSARCPANLDTVAALRRRPEFDQLPALPRPARPGGGVRLGREPAPGGRVRPGRRRAARAGPVPHLIGCVLAGGREGRVAALDLALRRPNGGGVPAAAARRQPPRSRRWAGGSRAPWPPTSRTSPGSRRRWRTTSGSWRSAPRSSGRRGRSTTKAPSPRRTTSRRAPTCSRRGSTLERHRVELAQARSTYLTTLGITPRTASDTAMSAPLIQPEPSAPVGPAASSAPSLLACCLPQGRRRRLRQLRGDRGDRGRGDRRPAARVRPGGGRPPRQGLGGRAWWTPFPLLLERQALVARRAAAAARTRESGANIAALEVQRSIADRELARTERLLKQAAATAQQGDRAEHDARVVREQLAGARAARGSRQPGGRRARGAGGLHRREARSEPDHAARSPAPCSPATSKPGEFVQAGQPLFKLASLDSLTFRAYVSNAQLTQLRLGQQVQVGVDRADSIATLPGPGHLDRLRGRVHPHADPDPRRAGRPGVRGEGRRGQSRRPAPDRHARRADDRTADGGRERP